jgi:hypothetical protein
MKMAAAARGGSRKNSRAASMKIENQWHRNGRRSGAHIGMLALGVGKLARSAARIAALALQQRAWRSGINAYRRNRKRGVK